MLLWQLTARYMITIHSSDHLPLSLTLSLAPTVRFTRAQPRSNWSAAIKDGLIEAYATAVGEIVRSLLGQTYVSTSSLDEEVHHLSAAILQAASSTIPTRKQKKGKKHFSNDPTLRKLSIEGKAAWKRWRKAGSPMEGPEFEEKTRLHRLTKQCANKCRANLERKSWKSRESMYKTKGPRRFRVPSNQLSLGDRLLHNGEVTSDPTTVQECWTNHFQCIFQSKAGTSASLAACQKDVTRLASLSRMNVDDVVDDDFTVEEMEASLKKLKCGKAGGFDGLQPEHLKYGGPLLTLWVKQIFCAFAYFEYISSSLLTGIIRPIYSLAIATEKSP